MLNDKEKKDIMLKLDTIDMLIDQLKLLSYTTRKMVEGVDPPPPERVNADKHAADSAKILANRMKGIKLTTV